MKFSIIIPYYNGEKYIEKCLYSIVKRSVLKNYEIIVVDDNSNRKISKRIKNEFNFVKYLNNKKNLGFVRTCNKGAKISKGEFLIFLNMDTVIDTENWLNIIEKTFSTDKKIGIVGVKLIYPEINLVQSAGNEINPITLIPTHIYKFAPNSYSNVNKYRELNMVTGAALFIRRDIFNRVQGFSTDFKSVFEDCDLCLQIRELNYKVVYQPLVTVLHYESVTGISDVMTFNSYIVFYKKWEKYIFNKKKSIYELDGYNDAFIRRLLSLYFKNFKNIIFTMKKLKLKSKEDQVKLLQLNNEEIIDLVIKRIKKGEDSYLSDFIFYKMVILMQNKRENNIFKFGKRSINLNPESMYSDTIKILFWMLDKRKKCDIKTFKNYKSLKIYLFLNKIESNGNIKDFNLTGKYNIMKTLQLLILLINIISMKRLKIYINYILENVRVIENIDLLINFFFLVLYRDKSYKKNDILKRIILLIRKYDWPKFKQMQFYINLGSYYEKKNELTRAEKYFKKVIKVDTKREFLSSAYFHLGICSIDKNKSIAKSYFSKCLDITPGHIKANKLFDSI